MHFQLPAELVQSIALLPELYPLAAGFGPVRPMEPRRRLSRPKPCWRQAASGRLPSG